MNIRQIFNLLCVFIFTGTLSVHAQSASDLQGGISWACVQFAVVPPYACVKPTPPYFGINVAYWEPVLLIETVKKPGDTVVPGMSTIVGSSLQSASQGLMSSVTGMSVPITSGSSSNADDTNTQMNEAHVYGFPWEEAFNAVQTTQCPMSTELNNTGVIYLSEADSIEWRLALLESMNPKSLLSSALGPVCSQAGAFTSDLCMGYWGPTYPRRGYMTHQSEVVGSAADSFRAASIAGIVPQTPHVIIRPLLWQPNPQADKLQELYPNPGMCMNIGENPMLWESGKTSLNGKYVWLYWKRKTCCIY